MTMVAPTAPLDAEDTPALPTSPFSEVAENGQLAGTSEPAEATCGSHAASRQPASQALVPQPDALRLPIRVPVSVDLGSQTLRAEVIGSTDGVLLIQSLNPGVTPPPLGKPIRLRSGWDRQVLYGRIAAHGVAGRWLVSLGERAIRHSRRLPVDLIGQARGIHSNDTRTIRIIDLSAGGARVEGLQLPVGSEVALRFTPPNHPQPLTVSGFVVRVIDGAPTPTVGVAFRLVQSSMNVLGRAAA